jgi:hypothetical protein
MTKNVASTDEVKVVVSVKKKHILAGVPMKSKGCAIALALQERFKDADAYMVVHLAKALGRTWEVDRKARDFVFRFDTTTNRGRKMMRPFRFEMVRKA